ncbi:hypothetical protein [Paenibacillus sp. YN15]|uniref:hypothetical protein n=1 Tax=Paenibacillus sp. YN15 TaxID=1742774 RepID=UPI000DCBC994|nr:hypothetical protein [Paenibacillus sp. YN15]RAU97339.1 hypothetical protein DQG13_19075 [Paenibacillus sp. YN15]
MNTIAAIYVKDFKGEDDAGQIRAAVGHALETGIRTLVFEPRTYRLHSVSVIETEGFRHDADSPDAVQKACHIPIRGISGLVLQGAVNDDGTPATVLAGYNDMKLHNQLPAILWCEDCPDLSVVNLAFTREPAYSSAGEVVYRDDNGIKVKVFEGNLCYDGMGTYCMNRFDPVTGALSGESVTYGYGASAPWKLEKDGLLSLACPQVAAKVREGEHLSWHQGACTDFQTYFGRCDRLKLSNLRTYSANGFCMLTEFCRGITADRVVFKPGGNRLFTAPRDAWKLFKCTGQLSISRMEVQGVRMDGQNMHSNWLVLERLDNSREALFHCLHTYAPLQAGTMVRVYTGEVSHLLEISEWSPEGRSAKGYYYRIAFTRDLPAGADVGTLAAADCWEPERYICTDSSFINIAGAGHLVRHSHLYLINCLYKNTMNPGVLLGAELPTHSEGGHASDILIKGCEFDNCGFFPRYGASGCIGIKSSGFSGKFNKHVLILDNVFKNAQLGVHAVDADEVFLLGNRFVNVETPLLCDSAVGGTVTELGSVSGEAASLQG